MGGRGVAEARQGIVPQAGGLQDRRQGRWKAGVAPVRWKGRLVPRRWPCWPLPANRPHAVARLRCARAWPALAASLGARALQKNTSCSGVRRKPAQLACVSVIPSSRTLGSGWQQSSISSWNLHPGRQGCRGAWIQGSGLRLGPNGRQAGMQGRREGGLDPREGVARLRAAPQRPPKRSALLAEGGEGGSEAFPPQQIPARGHPPAPGPLPGAPGVDVQGVEGHSQRGQAAVCRLVLHGRRSERGVGCAAPAVLPNCPGCGSPNQRRCRAESPASPARLRDCTEQGRRSLARRADAPSSLWNQLGRVHSLWLRRFVQGGCQPACETARSA